MFKMPLFSLTLSFFCGVPEVDRISRCAAKAPDFGMSQADHPFFAPMTLDQKPAGGGLPIRPGGLETGEVTGNIFMVIR